MTTITSLFARIRKKLALKPEQAELLAKIKFPFC